MPTVSSLEGFSEGTRRAMIAPATIRDRYRITPDDGWHHIDTLDLGQFVYEFNISGLQTFTLGKDLHLSSLLEPFLQLDLRITAIELVRANQLTPAHREALGPPRYALGFDEIEAMGDRRGWFLTVDLIPTGT